MRVSSPGGLSNISETRLPDKDTPRLTPFDRNVASIRSIAELQLPTNRVSSPAELVQICPADALDVLRSAVIDRFLWFYPFRRNVSESGVSLLIY